MNHITVLPNDLFLLKFSNRKHLFTFPVTETRHLNFTHEIGEYVNTS